MTLRKLGLVVAWGGAGLLFLASCGDDSGGGGAADAATSGGSGGTGGTGGSDAGGVGTVDVTACVAAGDSASAMGFATRPQACKECVCGKCTMAEVSACDDMCWALIGCVGNMCAGLVDPERTTCAISMCGSFLTAAVPAMAIGTCGFGTDSCEPMCRVSTDAGTGTDAGADADGG